MLRAMTAATSTASAAPLPVREAPAAAASAGAGPQPNPVPAVESAAPQMSAPASPGTFRYNSSEFVYRQDIGRIILVGQSPVTGEHRSQIPSEEALRAYERTIRAEAQRALLAGQAPGGASHASSPEPAPRAPALPSLPQALSAVVGGDSGAVVSVSA